MIKCNERGQIVNKTVPKFNIESTFFAKKDVILSDVVTFDVQIYLK